MLKNIMSALTRKPAAAAAAAPMQQINKALFDNIHKEIAAIKTARNEVNYSSLRIHNLDRLGMRCNGDEAQTFRNIIESELMIPRFLGVESYSDHVESINEYLLLQVCSYVFIAEYDSEIIFISPEPLTYIKSKLENNQHDEILIVKNFIDDFQPRHFEHENASEYCCESKESFIYEMINNFSIACASFYKKNLA